MLVGRAQPMEIAVGCVDNSYLGIYFRFARQPLGSPNPSR